MLLFGESVDVSVAKITDFGFAVSLAERSDVRRTVLGTPGTHFRKLPVAPVPPTRPFSAPPPPAPCTIAYSSSGYAAPEQQNCTAQGCGLPADVFAAGITLFEVHKGCIHTSDHSQSGCTSTPRCLLTTSPRSFLPPAPHFFPPDGWRGRTLARSLPVMLVWADGCGPLCI